MALGTALLLIAIVALLIYSERFRKFAGVSLLVLVVVGFVFYAWLEQNSRESRRRYEQRKTLIKGSEIELFDLRLSRSSYNGSPEYLYGRVRNNSRYALSEVRLILQYRDCVKPDNCETVGEDDVTVREDVPPGQSRDFQQSVLSSTRIAPRGSFDGPTGSITS